MLEIVPFAFPLVLPILGLLLLITILTPTLRWPFAFILLVAAGLAGGWLYYRTVAPRPNRAGIGPHFTLAIIDANFALAVIEIAAYLFAIAVGIYLAGVTWWKLRR